MRTLRTTLLSMDFNSCILLFSNNSNLPIEQCLDDALVLYDQTPLSVLVRKFNIGSESPVRFLYFNY